MTGFHSTIDNPDSVRIHNLGLEEVKRIRAEMEKTLEGINFLGTLGNNAPFIGLFGTVLGIVTAFRELGNSQAGAMGNVMSGIAEALIATAVGIIVALPAVIFYNVFQKKGSDIEENAAALGNVVIAAMRAYPSAKSVVADSAGCAITWDLKYKIRGVDRFFVFDPDENRIEVQGSDGTGTSRWE